MKSGEKWEKLASEKWKKNGEKWGKVAKSWKK